MAIAAPTQIGTYVGTTSVASHVLSLTSGAAVGDLVVVQGGGSNGRTLSSVTDTKGNTWNLETTVASTTVADCHIAWAVLTVALVAADTITFNLSGASSFAMQAIDCTLTAGWTWPSGSSARDTTAGATGNSAGVTGTQSTAGPGGTPSQGDELFLDLTAIGGAFTVFAATGSYAVVGSAQSTGTIRGVGATYLVRTTVAAETGISNWTSARAWAARLLSFAPTTSGTVAKPVVDSGTVTDGTVVSATTPTTDTAAVTDTAAITAPVATTDAGALSEASSVAISVPTTDAGAVTDTTALVASAPVVEAATLTDTAAVASFISIVTGDSFQVGDYPGQTAITLPAPVTTRTGPPRRYYLRPSGAVNVRRRIW